MTTGQIASVSSEPAAVEGEAFRVRLPKRWVTIMEMPVARASD